MLKKLVRGMTLLELMITIAILGILATLAYPVYTNYITRMHRAEAIHGLMDLAIRMQNYYLQNQTYATATIGTGKITDILNNPQTRNGWYTLAITQQSPTTYVLQAIPNEKQAHQDIQCGTLSLDQANTRSISGLGQLNECWS